MENKNNGGLMAIIILLIIALLGAILYIGYDKGLIFNSEKELEENEESKPEEKDEYNYTEISNLINEKLTFIISRYGFNKNGIDLLNTADARLTLVNYLLMSDAQEVYDGQGRTISYDKYSSKYNELYGENYSLETDLLNVSSKAVASQEGTNISWNATWGTSGLTYDLTAQNITNNNDLYTLTGTYIKTTVNDNSTINGTFEIKYIRTNNTNKLQSITLTDK